jgi:benzoyl-CoA reductase subunit D
VWLRVSLGSRGFNASGAPGEVGTCSKEATGVITAGIDCGAKNTKTVILGEGKILGKGKVITGFDPNRAIVDSFERACESAGIRGDQVETVYGTGSGKDSVKKAIPRTMELVNDIKAMGKAAHYFFPAARTVADVGAEEGRAAKLDERGRTLDFAVNEKCAAGAGAFIEAMSRALETELADLGPMALESEKEIPMNAQCAIFAESEVVGLIHAKTKTEDISKAIHDAMAGRIVSMIRRIGVNEEVVLLGGVGRNIGFVAAVKKQLGIETFHIPKDPEYGMAVGAALVAAEFS